jgi:hypothetical protein
MRLISSLFAPNRLLYSNNQLSRSSLAFTSFDSGDLLLAKDELINAWSVNGVTLNSDDITSNLFALSLFPYLAFLYFIGRPETNCPKISNFGFQFLLVFVFATIPAGIVAKQQYHDILANVDWLHFAAESLLTATNILIITGFRNLPKLKQEIQLISDSSFRDAIVISGIILAILSGNSHVEPSNALSLPTWIVHTSSLIEWLLAIAMVWRQADISGNPRWKGLAWGMLPAHASGVCACTFHFFYNSSQMYWLVVLQAALTVLGNSTLAYSAYRLYDYGKSNQIMSSEMTSNTGTIAMSEEDNLSFWSGAAVKSIVAAATVKYGELHFGFPFTPANDVAASVIIMSTCFIAASLKSSENKSSLQFL